MAPWVDSLYLTLVAISTIITLLVAGALFVFCVKYRRRPGNERAQATVASTRAEIFVVMFMILVFLSIFFMGARVYYMTNQAPPNAMDIYVVGKQWMWHLQHPGGQREINELHVPINTPIKVTLTSQDVIHDFSIPAFRVKQDVIPGRYAYMWFNATKPGKYHLFCAEYCGTDHSQMVGWVIAMEPREYQEWLRTRSDESAASRGRKLFLQFQCITCHNRESTNRAPILEEVYGKRVPLQDGTNVIADDAYLRESILQPRAKLVAGYRPIMPSYQGQADERDILDLIAFIRSLGPNQTPLRNEDSDPPEAAGSDDR